VKHSELYIISGKKELKEFLISNREGLCLSGCDEQRINSISMFN
jgi:hypothetical protein